MVAKRSEPQKRVTTIMDHADYAAGREKLAMLESALSDAEETLRKSKMRAGRETPEANHYLSIGVPPIPDPVARRAASRTVADAGSLAPGLVEKLRAGLPQPRVHESARQVVEDVMEAEASVTLLKDAIALAKANVQSWRKAAIAAVCDGVNPTRRRIAQHLAETILPFLEALSEERRLMETLALDDQDLPSALDLGPFPMFITINPALIDWLSRARPDLIDAFRRLPIDANSGEAAQASASAGSPS